MRVLIVDRVHPLLLEELAPFEVDYRPDIDPDTFHTILPDYDILVIRSKVHLDPSWIDRGERLRVIARYGSGLDAIDVEYARSKGIRCVNAPEGNRVAVAEQTIGMLLSLLADLPASTAEVRQRVWDRKAHIGRQLSHRTVGIIGFGHTGSAVAERLVGFGCRILAHDRFKQGFGSAQVEEVSLERIQREAEVISLHVSLNPTSRQLIDAPFIDALSRPVVLLNLSRGEVVDHRALLDGLRTERILGAGLDVYTQEDMAQLTEEQASILDQLSHHPRVILSPHTGGLSVESEESLAHITAAKIKRSMDA